jgi:hypothetical protein
MKTAISIPDPLFAAAEQFAHDNGLSRSELFARAVQLNELRIDAAAPHRINP